MRAALVLLAACALSAYACLKIHNHNIRSPCRACHVRAVYLGKPLLNEKGAPLLFATREDAERYARDYATP